MALEGAVVAAPDVAWLVVLFGNIAARRAAWGGGGDDNVTGAVAPTLTAAAPTPAGAVKVFGTNTSALRTNGGRDGACWVTWVATDETIVGPLPEILLVTETVGMGVGLMWAAGKTDIAGGVVVVLVEVVVVAEVVVVVGSSGPAGVRRGATNGRADVTMAAPAVGKYDERVSLMDADGVVGVMVVVPEVAVGVVGRNANGGGAIDTASEG